MEESREKKAQEASGDFAQFCQIVEQLRGPQGCPWDREQTFVSLKTCMINEMTEALAGIDLYMQTGRSDNLCEELGDVLLQVVLLAQIAKEKGLFEIGDVIEGISEKMIRRHPHVFGEEKVPSAEEIPGSWERIKQAEKKDLSDAQKYAEKAAFRAAAGQVICYLSEK